MRLDEWIEGMREILPNLDRVDGSLEVERNAGGNLILMRGSQPYGYIDVLFPRDSDIRAYFGEGDDQ